MESYDDRSAASEFTPRPDDGRIFADPLDRVELR